MNVLAFDTSSERMIVCLQTNGTYFETLDCVGSRHSERLMSEIDSILKKGKVSLSNLDLIVCTRGPGSFTGLRIGIATAKGLSSGTQCPMVSVPTLEYYQKPVSAIHPNTFVLPLIDARKGRFYTALYFNGNEEIPPVDSSLTDFSKNMEGKTVLITGPDKEVGYQQLIEIAESQNRSFTPILFDNPTVQFGKSLIEIGIEQYKKTGADAPAQGPVYIRKSDAEILFKG